MCACACACACVCACLRVCMCACACACACTSRQDLDDVPPADAGRASATALPSLLADHDLAAMDANVIVAVSVSTRSTLECPDSTQRAPPGEYPQRTRRVPEERAKAAPYFCTGNAHLGQSHLGHSHLGHSHLGPLLRSTEPTSAPGLVGWIGRGVAAAAAERGRQGPKWGSPKWEGTKREGPKWDWPCRCGCGRCAPPTASAATRAAWRSVPLSLFPLRPIPA